MVHNMPYTLEELALVLSKLVDYGIDFVIIGDTVVQLALKKKELKGDVDLFVIKPSVIVDEQVFIDIAEKEKWLYTTTEAGTPKLIARVDDKEIPIELYENIFDIYIPEEIISSAKSINVKGRKIRIIKPEEYLVLKAKQGVDIDKLASYIRDLKHIDRKLLIKTINLMPDEERKVIIHRLKEAGLTF